MKISLFELEACIKHIKENSFDMSLLIREDGHKSLKVTVGSKSGAIIEYEIYDEELNTHARVRESKELCLK